MSMTLKDKLANINRDNVCRHIIATHLKEVNPHRCSNMLVWGAKQTGFMCQALEGNETYGHEFNIDIENETLTPIIR